jgi:hypothetical protein
MIQTQIEFFNTIGPSATWHESSRMAAFGRKMSATFISAFAAARPSQMNWTTRVANSRGGRLQNKKN